MASGKSLESSPGANGNALVIHAAISVPGWTGTSSLFQLSLILCTHQARNIQYLISLHSTVQ